MIAGYRTACSHVQERMRDREKVKNELQSAVCVFIVSVWRLCAPYGVAKSTLLLTKSGTRAKVKSADASWAQLPKRYVVTLVSAVECWVRVCVCIRFFHHHSDPAVLCIMISRSNKRRDPFFSLYTCVIDGLRCPLCKHNH